MRIPALAVAVMAGAFPAVGVAATLCGQARPGLESIATAEGLVIAHLDDVDVAGIVEIDAEGLDQPLAGHEDDPPVGYGGRGEEHERGNRGVHET